MSNVPHQRSPYAKKFDNRSHEETERQQRCARSKAWNLAAMCPKQGVESCQKHVQAQRKGQDHFPLALGRLCIGGYIHKGAGREREREFVVDSGAGMHMVSKKDINYAELETMRTSRSPTTVMTANGELQTREEATVCVKELDLFVTVKLLEDTPAVLTLRKLCEDHGYTYHWTSGQKPHLIRNGKRIVWLQYIKQCAILSPWFINEVLHVIYTNFFIQHVHRKILWLARKIQQQKEVQERVRSHGETRCPNQQNPKTQLKMKETRKYRVIYCMTCGTGCRSSERIWLMNVVL